MQFVHFVSVLFMSGFVKPFGMLECMVEGGKTTTFLLFHHVQTVGSLKSCNSEV